MYLFTVLTTFNVHTKIKALDSRADLHPQTLEP